jgi:hypothetical protein
VVGVLGAVTVWVEAPPSLHDVNTYWQLVPQLRSVSADIVCVDPTCQTKTAGVITRIVSTYIACRFDGELAIVTFTGLFGHIAVVTAEDTYAPEPVPEAADVVVVEVTVGVLVVGEIEVCVDGTGYEKLHVGIDPSA